MEAATDQVTVFKMTMGQGPYRLIGTWSAPCRSMLESNPAAYNNAMRAKPECCKWYCDHCGTPIEHHMIVVDSNGDHFSVGSDCSHKLNDARLSTAVKEAIKKRNRQKAQDKRAAERAAKAATYEAELDDQRLRNGGMTDYEKNVEKNKALRLALRADRHLAAADIIACLHREGGNFSQSMIESILAGSELRPTAIRIICEIMAKIRSGSRKNSKAYNAKYDDCSAELNEAMERLKKIK